MRTDEGRAFLEALKVGEWVTRREIFEYFGTQSEFRRQCAEFRPDLLHRLGSRCSRRGIEVREDSRIVDVGDHCRESMGRMAASQAVKVASVNSTQLSDEKRRQAERAVGFFSATAVASRNKELKGDIAARLLNNRGEVK